MRSPALLDMNSRVISSIEAESGEGSLAIAKWVSLVWIFTFFKFFFSWSLLDQ